MISHIVVAVDASPSSNRAVRLAGEMASKHGSKLTLLHVVRDMQLPDELRHMAEVEHIEGARADVLKFVGDKILKEAKRRASEEGATDIHKHVGEGDPAGVIIDFAKNNGADMIVIGTRGQGEVKSMLLGSVSRKVSNLTDTNCLIVH